MSMTAPRIVTFPDCHDPIIPADKRWIAIDDRTYGGEPTDPIGYGASEQEAIDSLMEQMEDGNDD